MAESSAARGRDTRRTSHFGVQRASHTSPPATEHSRADSREYNVGSSASPAPTGSGSAHNSWTPLQPSAARPDAAAKHHSGPSEPAYRSRQHSGTSDTTQRSKHHSGSSNTAHRSKHRSNTSDKRPRHSRQRSAEHHKPTAPSALDEYTLPSNYDYDDDAAAPPPVVRGGQRRLWQPDSLEDELQHSSRGRSIGDDTFEHEEDLTELSALPPVIPRSRDRSAKSRSSKPSRHGQDSSHVGSNGSSSTGKKARPTTKSTTGQQQKRASKFATQLYTVSYLILFAILGTLARLGVQWLTFYPGAPVIFSELWANVGGALVMGFLAEDRNIFRDEWGTPAFFPALRSRRGDEEMARLMAEAKEAHGRVKRTIPLYIGLTTGFCGSFTSFSSFMRDVFLALSNDLPSPLYHPYPPGASLPGYGTTIPRNGGYSFMAIIAVIAITTGLCLSAYLFGAHVALALEPVTPTLPFRLTRRILDRAVVPIAWLAWLGAIFMTVWPPDRGGGGDETWRGQALFACVFAPLGCLLRFYAAIKLNRLIPSFPLGTFAANVFGTAVLGMAYVLQHVPLDTVSMGGGRLGCQALEGVMDGFCGCLTTVSTWVVELKGLRLKHAYIYGVVSVAAGLGTLVVVMGSVKWTIGFGSAACVTSRWS